MDIVSLDVKKREKAGSEIARTLRNNGQVPAVLYGHGIDPISLAVDRGGLIHSLHTKAGENVVLELKVEGAQLKESTCRIKEIQHHPVTDEIQHVDFILISLREKIDVNVPVVARHHDEAAGVKEGGVLDIVHHELPIKCLPTQIPDSIEIDVKEMQIGEALHLKDVELPEGIEPQLDGEEVLIALHPPRVEEEKPADEEGDEAQQPEVIEKGKKPEEGEAAGDAAPAEQAEKKE